MASDYKGRPAKLAKINRYRTQGTSSAEAAVRFGSKAGFSKTNQSRRKSNRSPACPHVPKRRTEKPSRRLRPDIRPKSPRARLLEQSRPPLGAPKFWKCRGFARKAQFQWETTPAWLGREDSNLRMAESKSAALPLGYAPIGRSCLAGGGATIGPGLECRNLFLYDGSGFCRAGGAPPHPGFRSAARGEPCSVSRKDDPCREPRRCVSSISVRSTC